VKARFIILIGYALSTAVPAVAGGLLGDVVSGIGNVVAPGSNIGKPLDDLNRNIKKDVPIYGTVEEGASDAVRHTTQEFLVENAGPILAGLIQTSRNDTLNGGVQDVPDDIRSIMSQFYGFDIAAGIRYRIGQGGDLALASNAFRYGDAIAITLYDLIVFRDQATAQDLSVWAHELQHVQQFRGWGVLDFSKRYVRDHQAVENEAYATQDRYRAWAQVNLAYNGGGDNVFMPPQPQLSGICGTPVGMCVVPGMVPVGTGCWCGSMNGPINGQVVPQ
jgi:hypothetical protein